MASRRLASKHQHPSRRVVYFAESQIHPVVEVWSNWFLMIFGGISLVTGPGLAHFRSGLGCHWHRKAPWTLEVVGVFTGGGFHWLRWFDLHLFITFHHLVQRNDGSKTLSKSNLQGSQIRQLSSHFWLFKFPEETWR